MKTCANYTISAHYFLRVSIPSLIGLFVLAAAPVWAAAGQVSSPQPRTVARAGPGTARNTAPDAELERAIRERFAKSKIAVNKFTVRVQGGVATIEGRTDVIQHKATATRLARNAGAREVINKVQVSDQARQKAADNLAKGRRRAQLKRSEAERR